MGILLAAGCRSTSSDMDLSSFLSTMEEDSYSMADAPPSTDNPDQPVAPVPPEAMAGPAGGPSELTIQKDCLLQISVAEDPGLDGSYPVNDIGAVQLGYIGPVILFNKTEKEAAAKIAGILEHRDFRNATVKVRILRASYDKVRVAGSVSDPGLISIGAGDAISLNDVLLRGGGVRGPVKDIRVKIVRGGLLTAVAPALTGEDYMLVDENSRPKVPDVQLRNNDVAYVYAQSVKQPGRRGLESKTVLVLGEVKRKGFYNFPASESATVMNLVFKMGGFPRYADDEEVKIIRRDSMGNEQDFIIDVEEILEDGDPDKDFPLENGDRIVVPGKRISLF